MDFRQVITAAGDEFSVPEHILRRDDAALTGWQLRYGEWTDYPDLPGGRDGAEKALKRAMDDMQFRIDTLGK
ncbi:MAG TPA: hypothetical protein VFW68_02180 [Rhodocyclaceae bacterium]|nr:hypothetical protein [Rhodocyclaceae bacterium]